MLYPILGAIYLGIGIVRTVQRHNKFNANVKLLPPGTRTFPPPTVSQDALGVIAWPIEFIPMPFMK